MNEINEFKKLLKENIEISKKIYKNTEKIKRHFFWTKIWKSIKFAVIIGLIVAGIFYSKPYIKQIFEFYRNIIQMFLSPDGNATQMNESQINLDPATIKQLQEIFKSDQLQ
jgi:hypothetical protein